MQTPKKFSIAQAVKFAWYTLLEHLDILLFIFLVWLAMRALLIAGLGLIVGFEMIKSLADRSLATEMMRYSFFSLTTVKIALITISLYIAYAFITSAITLGIKKMMLDLYDHGTTHINQLLSLWPRAYKQLLAFLLYCLIVFAGLICLVVPGIYLALKYCMYGYAIVEENAGPLQALDRSGQITMGAKKDLLLFWLLFGIFNIIGFSTLFCIGLVISIPLTFLAQAYVYRQLLADAR